MSFTKKNLEHLAPSEISQQLRERVAQLNALLDLKFRALKKAPEGSLRISQCRGDVQYYHRETPNDQCGHYIDAAHYELAQKLAQKDYNQRLVISLQKEVKILEGTLRQLEKMTELNETPETLANKLHPLRRPLIQPATLTASQYAAAWSSQKYKGKTFQPDAKGLYTSSGKRVRSKSEVIIAETLARLEVPYHYEYPHVLISGAGRHGKITVYPDFLCLNLRTRQEFIWEHFGLMDDPKYAANFVRKLHTYADNGIIAGHNLIITTESSKEQLNPKHVEDLIKLYLK